VVCIISKPYDWSLSLASLVDHDGDGVLGIGGAPPGREAVRWRT
jgi:hypothetical protein